MSQYASVEEMSDFLGQTFDQAQKDRARLHLELVSAQIESETGRTFGYVPDDEVTFYGSYEPIQLPNGPVTEVTSVVLSGGVYGSTPMEVTDFWLVGDSLMREGQFGGPETVITVTYSHGEEDVPPDVKQACLVLAAMQLDPASVSGEQVDGTAMLAGLRRKYRRKTASLRIG